MKKVNIGDKVIYIGRAYGLDSDMRRIIWTDQPGVVRSVIGELAKVECVVDGAPVEFMVNIGDLRLETDKPKKASIWETLRVFLRV
jgi:hypothetical protein